jgi:chromate transporter
VTAGPPSGEPHGGGRAQPGALWELALLFLRLGTTAFGGPAAHIAMMEEEVVRRRGWLGRDEFLDLLGATNLIPGPNSTELAIHIGHRRAGWAGLVVAGGCFILPAALMVGAIASAYVRFGRLPAVSAVLYGIKPVMIAVVLQALWLLARTALKNRGLAALTAAGVVAAFLHVNELLILIASGAVVAAAKGWRARPGGTAPAMVAVGGLSLASAPAVATPPQVASVFLVFAKIGSVLYGSGYVLLAFLRADLVQRLGWLTEGQLLDSVAVGQITPGPVFTTATFVGYVLAGWSGALAATAGIFLPAFVFVALSGPLVPRIRRSPVAGAFLDGVNAASLALMSAVVWELGRAALVDRWTVATALVAAALLIWRRINSVWLVILGAVVGVAVRGGLG